MKKLKDSRFFKLALLAFGILVIDRILCIGITAWIVKLIRSESADSLKIQAYTRLVEIISVPIAGSVAAIVIALAGRYGAREATYNLGNRPTGDYDTFTGGR